MKNQYLLLEDVDGLGRSGDIVSVKKMGYVRNFLLPQQKAIIAQKHLVRLQAQLKEERAKRAVKEKAESEQLAEQLAGKMIKTEVKVDAEGHMFGSVNQHDIIEMLKDQLGVTVEKRHVVLQKPIKKLGVTAIQLKLPEGILASVNLEITAEPVTTT